jgi:hypothetical protein
MTTESSRSFTLGRLLKESFGTDQLGLQVRGHQLAGTETGVTDR